MEVGASVEVFRGTKLVASLPQGFRAVDQPTVASATWRAPAGASSLATVFRFCVTANDTAGAVGERSCAPITLRRP
jgi:hypothetical protein